jgi:chromosome segregation ATPase
MATMTHEAPASPPVRPSSSVQRELEARISEAQRKVNTLEAKIREEQERLVGAREIYSAACQRLADGKNADLETARSAYLRHEAKLEGMQALLREPKRLLDQLRQEMAAEVARADEARLSVEIIDEQDTIENQAERAFHAIDDRDRCIESIAAIVANLRSKTYRTAANKHAAFQAAHRIERKASGLLN